MVAKTHYGWPKICMGSKESWARELDKRKVEKVLRLRKEQKEAPIQPMSMGEGKCMCETLDYIKNPSPENQRGRRRRTLAKIFPRFSWIREGPPLSAATRKAKFAHSAKNHGQYAIRM